MMDKEKDNEKKKKILRIVVDALIIALIIAVTAVTIQNSGLLFNAAQRPFAAVDKLFVADVSPFVVAVAVTFAVECVAVAIAASSS